MHSAFQVDAKPLRYDNQTKRQDWAKKHLKTDASQVLCADEMRGTLDGSDGSITNGHKAGGVVLVWAGNFKNDLVPGPNTSSSRMIWSKQV